MNYTVIMTETAKEDLREIAFWIAEKSGYKDIAKEFVICLREECRKLERFPQGGAFPKDRILRGMGYRYRVYQDYLIFYLIDDEAKIVNIMAIFNSKKDYMRVMRRFI